MTYKYPFSIENPAGERILFHGIEHDPKGDKVILEGFAEPNCGPPMHVHFKQDEGFTIVSGKMGYQLQGQEPVYLEAGASMVFSRGTPHRFWNAGNETLHLKGFVQPANNLVFFLDTLYAAQRISGKEQPEAFTAAFLLTRYKSEFDMLDVPKFVRRVIIPLTYFIGRISGKYAKYKNAPAAVK
ncbi:MAG: cupin domain-containing protein [Chitinophagales bacterium]